MPCDTPPPPVPVDNEDNDVDEDDFEELDEAGYEFIDADEPVEDMVVTQDDAIATYLGHTDSVFTCSFDKSGRYIVSGSQDEKAYVWDVSYKTIKHECPGHKESVVFAKFSPDSKYVATADLSGIIQVFSVDDGHLVWSFECYEFKCMTWLHKSNTLLAGSVDGTVWKWSIPDGATSVYENSGTSVAEAEIAVTRNDEKLCVGYCDGSIKVWNLNSDSLLGSISGPSAGPSAIKSSINDIKVSSDSNLMLAGSEDGDIKLIKMFDFKVLWTIHVCDINIDGHEDCSVESVGFCQNLMHGSSPTRVAAATNCGVINVYDISSKTKRCSITVDSSVVKIICDDTSPVLYAALAEGVLQAYDVRTGNLLKSWTGHRAGLLDVSISSDESHLLTCSDDASIKMFEKGDLLGDV